MEELCGERLGEDVSHHTFAVDMDERDSLELLNLLPEEGDARGDVLEALRRGVVIGELDSSQVVAEHRRGLPEGCPLDEAEGVAQGEGCDGRSDRCHVFSKA